MDPIIPIEQPSSKPSQALRARGARADQLAAYLAFASAFLALCVCAYFWARFLENDENNWGMVSAFFLCFGGGAFAYIPAWLTGKIAFKSYKEGADKKRYRLALCLIVPWAVLALTFVAFSAMALIYSLPILAITFMLVFWAGYSLYKG